MQFGRGDAHDRFDQGDIDVIPSILNDRDQPSSSMWSTLLSDLYVRSMPVAKIR